MMFSYEVHKMWIKLDVEIVELGIKQKYKIET